MELMDMTTTAVAYQEVRIFNNHFSNFSSFFN
jgi:hypothetical protein